MINHDGYDIVEDEKDLKKKTLNWEIAIGLNKVDGLYPSEYLLSLKTESIQGKATYEQIENSLKSHYQTQDMTKLTNKITYECDIVSTRIAEILADESFIFSPIYLKNIHKHLFEGVFEGSLKNYAGVFRDYNITKKEPILNNETVLYGNYEYLLDYLKYDFEEEKAFDYGKFDINGQIDRLQQFTSKIWQVHPFGEGNTRTTAVFIQKYLITKGWQVNNEPFKENAVYFRDALVLSNYSNIKNNIHENNTYLKLFFTKLLSDPNQKLPNMQTLNISKK